MQGLGAGAGLSSDEGEEGEPTLTCHSPTAAARTASQQLGLSSLVSFSFAPSSPADSAEDEDYEADVGRVPVHAHQLPDSHDAYDPDQSETAAQLLDSAADLPSTSEAPQPVADSILLPQLSLPATLESPEDASWRQHSKHFLVLTSSGKPIYSYHGETSGLAGLAALIAALVAVVNDQGDTLQYILSGPTLIVYMSRGPLYFVATSSLGEPVPVLQRQLELLYRQMLLILTSGLERILLRNPAYDALAMVDGVAPVLHTLVDRLQQDASFLLPGLQPLLLPVAEHLQATQALADAVASSGVAYGLLLAVGGHAIAVERNAALRPAPPLEAADVLVLDNFIAASPSIRQGHGEAFCPICLPAYSPSSFLHAYVHFFEVAPSAPPKATQAVGGRGGSAGRGGGGRGTVEVPAGEADSRPASSGSVYLVLLATTSDAFHAMSAARQKLERQLAQSGALACLQRAADSTTSRAMAISDLPKPLGGKLGQTALLHFMARVYARRQVVQSSWETDRLAPLTQEQLAVVYTRVHSLLWDHPPGSRHNKLVWLSSGSHIILAQSDAELECYLVLDPLTDKALATRLADQLKRHLMDRATQALMLLTAT